MNMHVKPAAALKIGDKIRWRGLSGEFFTNGETYEIGGQGLRYFHLTDNEQRSPDKARHHADADWILANFDVVPRYKIGDRVRFITDNPNGGAAFGRKGDVVTVTRIDDGPYCAYGGQVRFKRVSDVFECGAPFFAIELAPLTLQAGKFYKTRDGRKVGPLEFYGGSQVDCYWRARSGGLTNGYGSYWAKDGSYHFGQEHKNDLIAEWTEETPKPHTPTSDQWIVCLIEYGQPKPATRPFVHGGAFAANKEADRLAGVHRGQEFGVYRLVGTSRKAPPEPKVYAQEWKRLAKGGQKIAAIKELRSETGLNLKSAKDAVEGWLDYERDFPQYARSL